MVIYDYDFDSSYQAFASYHEYEPEPGHYQNNLYQQANNGRASPEGSIPLKESRLVAPLCAAKQKQRQAAPRQPFKDGAKVSWPELALKSKVIWVNLISVLINLTLALVAFYFAYVNDSSATSAFAADCILDFISSGIVLWRYFGNLTPEFARAREQIACLYLGALFELSGVGIILKASQDMITAEESSAEATAAGNASSLFGTGVSSIHTN